ncbi:hypothetical protein RAX57_000909 [Vibrio parahaemolyticus]|nr:hypothetical protein [Vibrio parahaemolyticus]
MSFSFFQINQFSSVLDSYRVHALMIEDFLESQIHELKEKTSNSDCSPTEMSIGVHDACIDEIEVIFPSIQRRAQVIVSYSVLEHQMLQICESIEKETDSLIKLKDLASNGIIDKCQKYLEKVALVTFPKSSESWKEVLFIQQIRNSLVHADGLIKTGNQDLRGYINQCKYLEISRDNKVVLLSGFTVHCVDVCCHFLTDLYVSISGEN